MLHLADRAMYAVKRSGKSAVKAVTSNGESPVPYAIQRSHDVVLDVRDRPSRPLPAWNSS